MIASEKATEHMENEGEGRIWSKHTLKDILHTDIHRSDTQLQLTYMTLPSPYYYLHQSFILICVYHYQHAPFQEATELIFDSNFKKKSKYFTSF